ncbi:MAG: UDP-N-acetylglucosamine 2-epimerase (hydrolyzing) [Planctomycetes bacterium]|nr:UDP-N-acetylglucosamine 2-epimerase (hydrolyzing) [Planctomycetota bacterium]
MRGKRHICVVTGSRAEYGLLRWLLEELRDDPRVELQLCVTGTHLSFAHGETWRTIVDDGFTIDAKVEMQLASDTGVGTAKSVGLGMTGFADAFARLSPDIVVVLGDRFEVLAAAQTAMALRTPIAHIHGGESTEGLWDEAIRHAVTKMAHLHFVAADSFRDRVVQLGEDPTRIFVTGAPGVDATERVDIPDAERLERELGVSLQPFFLVTYHPVTLADGDPTIAVQELFAALDRFPDHRVLVTGTNADAGGARIQTAMTRFAAARGSRVRVVDTLGQRRYLAAVRAAEAVVGNSSSGLIEAPSLATPTVNLGDRQRGRLRADSVVDAAEHVGDIEAALHEVLDPGFQAGIVGMVNPYGDGNASQRIAHLLVDQPLDGILMKRFHDLEVPSCAPS